MTKLENLHILPLDSHQVSLLSRILFRTQLPPNATSHRLSRARQASHMIRMALVGPIAIDSGLSMLLCGNILRALTIRHTPAMAPAHRSSSLHCTVQATHIETDLVGSDTCEVKIPVYRANEETTANEISKKGWDHRFPDVKTDADVWMADKDGDGDEIHICDHMVQTQCDESEGREPDCHNLGYDLAGRDGDEDGEADEPVCANGTAEYLAPSRCQHFHRCEVDDLHFVRWNIREDPAV